MAEIPNNPITRKEQYLAAIAGQGVAVPDHPITREEAYLEAIYENGGGSGTLVVANPTLVGTEDNLTGLQVGNTKYKVPSGGSGSAEWGSITGTLSNQTDLQAALNSKATMADVESYVALAVLGGED